MNKHFQLDKSHPKVKNSAIEKFTYPAMSFQQEESTTNVALTFEDAMKKLEEIVKILESGGIGLDEAVQLYNEAANLRQYCENKLKTAELQIYNIDQKSSEKDSE